jgi:hypothetical protein
MRERRGGTLTSCPAKASLMESGLGTNTEPTVLLQDRRSHLSTQLRVIDPSGVDDALCGGHDLTAVSDKRDR